ncbi:metal-sulfur cluster assembly factor [Ammoniphilus resinae]|uniref:Metal-sulfur cluster biosynthetic enzyme n=1 Tax=Ammoniphilus resinae TaxID=861532 RepID=A0ABS4GQZ9_9BACL|nr:metal-sulfur cluster assembly factor [Ammoniphilus resinae]MBP1932702.1 metal-sulfur cluster biosynthetic enzyme [Ammoniphilus resinae]
MITEEMVMQKLYEVYDPELGINIVDLGLVYDVLIEDDIVNATITLTTPGCPMHDSITAGARNAILQIEGVKRANVELTWTPAWNPEMMSERAKNMLGRA